MDNHKVSSAVIRINSFKNGLDAKRKVSIGYFKDKPVCLALWSHLFYGFISRAGGAAPGESLFVDGRTYARTYICTDRQTFETGFIRSTLKSQPKNAVCCTNNKVESVRV